MNETLAVIEQQHGPRDLSRPLTAADIRAQVNLIQEVMKAVMIDGTHFGVIPGTGDKPTLFKAGAEKILSTFRMGIKPVVEDLSTADEIRYRVHAECFVQATGNLLGVGVGEASTNEEKYKWRSAVCQEEFDATPEDRRRTKYARARSGGNGPAFYTANQIRTQPADLANTVLKMASKRAMMAVTLTVTAASDVFTQDIEDLPEEIRHDMAAGETSTEPAKPKPAADPPKQTAPTTASDGVKSVTGKVTSISPKQGSSNGRPWIKWAVKLESGASYTVFNKQEMADTAIAARDEKFAVVIHYKESAYGNDVVTIEPASARQPGGEG